MTNIRDIREIVNKTVPGVGKGIFDYAIKNLGLGVDSSDPNDIQKGVQEIIKHIQTLYGIQKAEQVKKELSNL